MCIHKSHQRKLAWERKRKFNNGMFYGCFVDFLSIKKKKNTTRCGGRRFMMAPALEKRQLSNWRENKLLLSVVSPITSPRCGVSMVSHGHLSGNDACCNLLTTDSESSGNASTPKTTPVFDSDASKFTAAVDTLTAFSRRNNSL